MKDGLKKQTDVISEEEKNGRNDVFERLELAIGRLSEIDKEVISLETGKYNEGLTEYFRNTAEFILYVYDVYNIINSENDLKTEYLKKMNTRLYEDILPQNYEKSFGNPDYAVERLGSGYGPLLCALYAEIRSVIAYAYEDKMYNFVITTELFLEIYNMLLDESCIDVKYIRDAIYYYMYDYADVLVAEKIRESVTGDNNFALNIIENSNLSDIKYLYSYGEYIGENEIKTAQYLDKLSEREVKAMADTYVSGFIRGFETMRIDLTPKKRVSIEYSIGQERMIKYAIEMFRKKGLSPIIQRYPVSRINRRLTIRRGFTGTPVNKQYEYDHRMDEGIFFDKAFAERKLEIIEESYAGSRSEALEYAGPAVVEIFGENPFKPQIKENAVTLTKKQQELSVEFASKQAIITNQFIPRDKYSFTIIAYPVPEIGENFEEIYDEIVRVNTLDNHIYQEIQQCIIDELDKAEYVHVVGKGSNRTDIKVMLHRLDNPGRETNFENCLADVNIPLGEVFTSPVLTGTNGILNVSRVYLNELKYVDLYLEFKDGRVSNYSCKNFDAKEDNLNFIKENLLFNHRTLPIGEFAIGTNTTAYAMAKKYDIIYKLPILIVEKMGPHFALGDTCYSYSEDSILFNPDGKEIIAKENECSILRREEGRTKEAYFNCHTDITIPYEEIGGIYAVHRDGTEVPIIENGRFVVKGTEELNKPLDEL